MGEGVGDGGGDGEGSKVGLGIGSGGGMLGLEGRAKCKGGVDVRALDGGGGGVEGQKKEGEQRRKLTQVRRASGRLPHLLSYCERSRRRVQFETSVRRCNGI